MSVGRKISKSERHYYAGWLHVLDDFIEAGNHNINEYLRYGTDVSSGKYARKAAKLKKIYHGLKEYEDFSYRVITVPSRRMLSFKIGDVVADKGFSCSSALFKNAKTWLRAQYINQFAEPGNNYAFIVYDKEVPKKIAGNHFLVDMIMLQPGEKIRINSIKNIYSSGRPIKILGVTKYDGDIPPVDIYSGE